MLHLATCMHGPAESIIPNKHPVSKAIWFQPHLYENHIEDIELKVTQKCRRCLWGLHSLVWTFDTSLRCDHTKSPLPPRQSMNLHQLRKLTRWKLHLQPFLGVQWRSPSAKKSNIIMRMYVYIYIIYIYIYVLSMYILQLHIIYIYIMYIIYISYHTITYNII